MTIDNNKDVVAAKREVLLTITDLVDLDDAAQVEVSTMVDMTVGRALVSQKDGWRRAAFHNFVIGNAARIADKAYELAPKPAKGEKPLVGRQLFVRAAIQVMNRTHELMERRSGGCLTGLKDETFILGKDTNQWGLCTEYAEQRMDEAKGFDPYSPGD